MSYHARHGKGLMTTALGGQVGIHGIGHGDPVIHEIVDWTQGCIAVTNEQIMKLERYLKVGTRVVIAG